MPEDASEGERLSSWCGGVGSPVVLATDTQTPAPSDLREITFVSWNVHVGNGDVRAFIGDLRSGALTPGRRVEHVVLLLQEAVRIGRIPAFNGRARGAKRIQPRAANADIEQMARDLGFSLVYVPSMRNGASTVDPGEDRGNAILSSVPLAEPAAVELPGERQRRVVVVARAGGINIASVHLDALGGPRRLWTFWTPWMREVQTRALTAVLPPAPLVLGGDLNTWHGTDEPAARALQRLPDATPLSAGPPLNLRTLDYLMFRAGAHRTARYYRVASSYGSDHQPLVGWFD